MTVYIIERNRFVFVLALLLFVLTSITGYAQRKDKSYTGNASPTVMRSTKESVTLDEFEKAYRRMNDKDPYRSRLDSLKDFLAVYSDYRLKLSEAKELGLDKDPKILEEIEGYRKLLAGPFILEKEITEPAVRKLWERRQIEVNAAHFLANFKNPNDPTDTLKAYNRAAKAIDMMNNGVGINVVVLGDRNMDFLEDPKGATERERQKMKKPNAPKDTNVWEGTDDKATMKTGGELGYFTGGMTVRQFEDIAYGLQIGEYNRVPIRTRFGYHVVQPLERHKRLGGVYLHHILVSVDKFVMGDDTLKYYQRADSILKVLRSGANFEKIAKEASDDKFTNANGGDMGYINREDRRAEKSFDHTAYDLKDGEISGVVRTSFGYHVIRRDSALATKSFDEEKEQLKKMYKGYYYNDDKTVKMAEFRKQFGAKVDTSTINIFMSRIDSSRTTLDSNWSGKFTIGERALRLYEVGGIKTTVAVFIDSLQKQPGFPLSRTSITDLITKNIDDVSLQLAAKDVNIKYPEFDQIMNDYKSGIMLFELENRRVWSKVTPDSVKEKKYYQDHKARYIWPERIDVSEIHFYTDTMANKIYKRILDGENFDTLAAQYTERAGFKSKAGRWGLMQRDENDMSKKVFNFMVDEIKPPFEFQSGYSIVRINKRIPLSPKTFDEARQEVASQYQDDLSSELRLQWVEELRKKYKREINTSAVETEWKKHQTY